MLALSSNTGALEASQHKKRKYGKNSINYIAWLTSAKFVKITVRAIDSESDFDGVNMDQPALEHKTPKEKGSFSLKAII